VKIRFSKCMVNKAIVILCIHVDDVCCFGDKKAIKLAIKEIEAIYAIKRVWKLQEFIGVNIDIEDALLTRLERNFKEYVEK
jgi:hypothetical protein